MNILPESNENIDVNSIVYPGEHEMRECGERTKPERD